MRKLIYSMGVSLDGYIADPNGEIDWSAPDEELHRFHNEQAREIDVHLLGRRLYEVMTYWETADEQPGLSDYEREFAEVWQSLQKVVFSRTLEGVEGTNVRLARGSLAEEVARLKAEPGKALAVGGAGLAAECMKLGLIDDYRLFVSPVILGGGTPYFAELEKPLNLELAETKAFGSQVIYARYLAAHGNAGLHWPRAAGLIWPTLRNGLCFVNKSCMTGPGGAGHRFNQPQPPSLSSLAPRAPGPAESATILTPSR